MKKHTISIVSAFAISAVAGNAMAYDVRIEINGELTSNTCKIEDSTGPITRVVTLPTLSAHALSQPGSSAGTTPLVLAISGCSDETAAIVNFDTEGANVSSAGRLKNVAATGAASNVEVQLLDGKSNVLNLKNDAPSYPIVNGAGDINLYARYFSPNGEATAGFVSSFIQISLGYI